MTYEPLSGLEILASFESLKVAIETHFLNITEADTCFGYDHAELLKRHIDCVSGQNTTTQPAVHDTPSIEDPPLEPSSLPEAIARFAPRATIDSPNNLGILGTLPREMRDLIYQYTLSVDCPAYGRACKCTRDDRQARSGLGLLRTSGAVHNEAISELYRLELFGIHLGYEKPAYDECPIQWVRPVCYHYVGLDRKDITCLPHNALQLIRNLEIYFINETLFWEEEPGITFVARNANFCSGIEELCKHLRQSNGFHSLDIHLYFTCKWADINYMACLVEPIKMLRKIKDPNITVYGQQFDRIRFSRYSTQQDPRWDLTEEFRNYLEGLLMSPDGMATYPPDGAEVFEDLYLYQYVDPLSSEWEEISGSNSDSEDSQSSPTQHRDQEELLRAYLRDVYGTDDMEALHGGMPERWQTWLNSEHAEDCEWFGAASETEEDDTISPD